MVARDTFGQGTAVTDRIALILAILIVAVLAIDHFHNHSELALFLGHKLAALIDFLKFWE